MTAHLKRKRRLSTAFRLVLWACIGLHFSLVRGQPTEDAHDFSRWEKDMQAFAAADASDPPPDRPIIFVGSSSIRLWQTLAHDFPEHPVVNRGFGGSEIVDSTHFADRFLIPLKPRALFLYAGTNDINSGKKAEEILEDFKRFSEKLLAALPELQIFFISLAPNPARWHLVDEFRRANDLIADYTRTDIRLGYVDVFSIMLGPDGYPLPEIFTSDQLHMNDRGYTLWKKQIAPIMEYLREDNADHAQPSRLGSP